MKGLKQGYVNKETLEITLMESKCLPKEKLQGHLIHIPTFNYSYKEKESLGNGWYSSDGETIHTSCDNAYLVIINNECIGYVFVNKSDRKVILQTLSKNNKVFYKAIQKAKDNFYNSLTI